ncbi:MAG: hypothetical protein ABJP45_19530 [Cyclobacteriaceae bacterium]
MGRIVIACYKPKPGKEKELDQLIQTHVDRLRQEGLVTDRESIVMKSESGTVIEVFEWKSTEAIEEAHSNPEVQKMWAEYAEVCNYEVPINIEEFQSLFSEFTPI